MTIEATLLAILAELQTQNALMRSLNGMDPVAPAPAAQEPAKSAKKTAEKPAEKPAAPSAAPAVTYDQVKAACVVLLGKPGGKPVLKALLEDQFKLKSAQEATPEQYPALLAAVLAAKVPEADLA